MDVWSGLFALGGVILGALFTEMHTRREAKIRHAADLQTVRRQTYSTALRHIETLSSATARWAAGRTDEEPVWDALSVAYATENEVRLVASVGGSADAMHRVIRIYRDALETDNRTLPVPREAKQELLTAFRRDLGIDPRQQGVQELP
jgi:hypothetical protein